MADEPVQGLTALLAAMEDLPEWLQQKLIREALEKGAEPIRRRAAQLAPDDPKTAGSRIHDNMIVEISEPTPTGGVAKIGPSQKGFMGAFAEHGTKRQRKTPFLGPAFEEQKETAVAIMGKTLADGIETFFRTKR